MKRLTQAGKNRSIKKWGRFIDDCEKKRNKNYDKYGNRCDFCILWYPCKDCPLKKKKKKSMRICSELSHVSEAIREAEFGTFKKAIHHGKIVLNAIKKVKIEVKG